MNPDEKIPSTIFILATMKTTEKKCANAKNKFMGITRAASYQCYV